MFKMPVLVADIDENKRTAAIAGGAAEAFDPADAGARKALLKATGGVYAACDFAGSEASLTFATGVLAKGGKAVVTGLIGGAYTVPVAMFSLKAMTIEGTTTGTLAEAHELIELVRAEAIEPLPIAERPFAAASATLDDLRAGRIVGRIVLAA
jgi:D-arabinose 1-dehydrogenase-like Zn-dependent alcohol dehydrogenase